MTKAEHAKAYRATPEGKAATARANAKYSESAKGKAVREAWVNSDKGKASMTKAAKKYMTTAKGKAAQKRKNAHARAKRKKTAAQAA